jgi:hypothetical protein
MMMKRNLMQMGYVTRDLEQALDYWIDVVGAGPFFYADYEPENQVYRGAPTHIRFRNAYGYLGGMQVEIIQQLSGGVGLHRGLERVRTHTAGRTAAPRRTAARRL